MTAKELRSQCTRHKGAKQCFICGLNEDITQAHHIMPLYEVKIFIEQGHTMNEPPVVWLCPNCHTRVHRIRKGQKTCISAKFLNKYFEIVQKRSVFLDAQFARWSEQCFSNQFTESS